MAWFYFQLTKTWCLSTVVGDNKIDNTEKTCKLLTWFHPDWDILYQTKSYSSVVEVISIFYGTFAPARHISPWTPFLQLFFCPFTINLHSKINCSSFSNAGLHTASRNVTIVIRELAPPKTQTKRKTMVTAQMWKKPKIRRSFTSGTYRGAALLHTRKQWGGMFWPAFFWFLVYTR